MLQVGGVDPKQLAVYEEFARNIPGFLPSNDLSQPTGFLAQPMKVNLSPVTIPKQNVRTKMVVERESFKVSACLINNKESLNLSRMLKMTSDDRCFYFISTWNTMNQRLKFRIIFVF